MRGSLLRGALLGAALGVGAWTSLARADGPPAPVSAAPSAPMPLPTTAPAPTPVQGQSVTIQGTIYTNPTAPTAAPAPCATGGAPDGAGGAPERSGPGLPHPLRDWWKNHERCGCWAHFNGFSCSSLASEYAFVFGSCRTFYNQPCMKGPPPPAYPGEPPLKNKCPNCVVP